jgi:putative MATE family efflux protein
LSEAARLLAMPPHRAVVRLAVPTTAVMVLGATSGVAHTYFVSRLGADAIAAVSLVFPVNLILMTMMGGGIGAGVSAAVAHALGAGRLADAESATENALWLVGAMAVAITVALVAGAPAIFGAMGGRGAVLDGAVLFARVLFGGSIVTFTVSGFDSILRGTGNVRIPSIWATVSLTLQILFTPLFMFPLGLGLAGAAAATFTGQAVGLVPRAFYIFGGRAAVRPRRVPLRPAGAPIAAILRIGVPASLSTLANYLGLMMLTAIVARYGTSDVAAFGLGTRLDFLVITLAFGVASAVLTLVGMARGAGDFGRVEVFVSRSAGLVAIGLSAVSVLLTLAPDLWLRIFTDDPAILDVGRRYLRAVAPSYPFVGAAMVFSFAFQGLGRAVFPLVLILVRTAVVVGASVALWRVGAPVGSIFVVMAVGGVASTILLFWRLRVLLGSLADRSVASAPVVAGREVG